VGVKGGGKGGMGGLHGERMGGLVRGGKVLL
jgi:hypothetical protein